MDPMATLRAAKDALDSFYMDDPDWDRFCELMSAYADWRNKGGFNPTGNGVNGDAFYGLLATRYGAMAGSEMRGRLPDIK